MTQWAIAIDFGTTNTAAAVCEVGQPDRAVEVKLSTSSSVMPSGVLAIDGDLLAGEVAANSWVTAPPGSYVRTPKRHVGEGGLGVGGRQYEVGEIVAAVLRTAVDRAARRFNGVAPSDVRLTHPAEWSRRRLDVLRDAAARADLKNPQLVSEPVAAARYYAHTSRDAGHLVAVYDLGGGTLDVAILQRHGDSDAYEVLAATGVKSLGGESFDQLLQQHVIDTLAARGDAEIAAVLAEGRLRPGEQRSFQDSVRNAKHTLSELTTAAVSVSAAEHATVVTVTRDDFHRLIDPGLDLSLQALRDAVQTAGIVASDLDRVYLVGGSSYIPRVAERLTAELGVTPATFDDPKLVTCLGALHTPAADAPPPAPPATTKERQPPPTPAEPAEPVEPAGAGGDAAPTTDPLAGLLTASVKQLGDSMRSLDRGSRQRLLELERAGKNRKTAIKLISDSLLPLIEPAGDPPSWQVSKGRQGERQGLPQQEKDQILAAFRASKPAQWQQHLTLMAGPPLRTVVVNVGQVRMSLLVHREVIAVLTTRGLVGVLANWDKSGVDRLLFMDDLHSARVHSEMLTRYLTITGHSHGRPVGGANDWRDSSVTLQTRAAPELCALLRQLYEQPFPELAR